MIVSSVVKPIFLRLGLLVLAALGLIAGASPLSDSEVQFGSFDSLSSNVTMARRLESPLQVDIAFRTMAQRNQRLAEQPLDLATEHYRIFIPSKQPTAGYGLMVFVPPWQGGPLIPPTWRAALDERGIIFVTAGQSGNDQPVLGRRDPLAILAATNVIGRYPVDRSRVYIAGFSGGSKVAFKLAVGYPDLFTGAFLLAGADALGDDGFVPADRALWARFRLQTRVVYVSGGRDEINVDLAHASAASLRRFCTQAGGMVTVPGLGHELIDRSQFGRVLDMLDRAMSGKLPAPNKCVAEMDAKVAVELDAIEVLIGSGQCEAARKRLLKLDSEYGGLALPRSLDLLHRIDGV